jgi:hypothetical protein
MASFPFGSSPRRGEKLAGALIVNTTRRQFCYSETFNGERMYKVDNPERFDSVSELGMGYHFGKAASGAGPRGAIVLNGIYAVTPEEIGDPRPFLNLVPEADLEVRDIEPSDNMELFVSLFAKWLANPVAYTALRQLHASPPFPRHTLAKDRFVRFSAFAADRRVLPDGTVLPGTYMTSNADALLATTGFAVVGRYALPNPLPAVHRFDLAFPVGTPVLVGTVAPAFGQAGGGVEIELQASGPHGTTVRRSTIPEY